MDDTEQRALQVGLFELEGLPGEFEGWHDPGHRWNGIANPLLGREESERFAATFNEAPYDGLRYSVAFDADEDACRVAVAGGRTDAQR